jgi:opacity protein-like surface antigen
MRLYLLAGAALATLAAPAAARDHSAYFGIEAGPMRLRDMNLEVDGVDLVEVDHKLGVDGDLIAGYDFGPFRAEIEGAYKWAEFDNLEIAGPNNTTIDLDGHSRAYSFMGNVMADLGSNETVNFYVGAGAGIAFLRQKVEEDETDSDFDVKDSGLAWQIIAGVRAPVFTHFDVGVKYRYFNGGRIKDEIDGDTIRTGRWKSHSLLASLIYNFAAPEVAAPPPPPPAPPPPPPAPAPATQTCPDGTVVLATEPCPAPPPAPPPPPPAPERG